MLRAVFDGGDFHAAEFCGGAVSFSRAEFSGGTVGFAGAGFSRRDGRLQPGRELDAAPGLWLRFDMSHLPAGVMRLARR